MKTYVMLVIALGINYPLYAALGINYPIISDSVNEYNAKLEANGLGITTVYDHTAQAPQGQFYVPIAYNRVGDLGAREQDPNSPHNTTDIDYVPLAQLKGLNGAAGAAGAAGALGAQGNVGSQGAQGTQGHKGDPGSKGDKGENGKDGRNGDDGNNRLTLNIGVSVRWYDWKHVNITSGYRYDINHYGHTVDMMTMNIKIGKSYEQRQTTELEKRLAFLESVIKGDR